MTQGATTSNAARPIPHGQRIPETRPENRRSSKTSSASPASGHSVGRHRTTSPNNKPVRRSPRRRTSAVVALASHSPRLVRPLGVRLPVYPVKGYSLTAPILDERAAPVSTVLDETYKVAVTRLGDRVRVGGTAELSGYSQDLRPGPIATLRACVSELFPGACDAATATAWTGLRAMTPTGVPAVGPTRIANLHLNTGHGTLGWTMACGAGRLLADLMTGKPTDIDPAPYDPRRLG